jgi:transglutaminase-like putative cysteine protease
MRRFCSSPVLALLAAAALLPGAGLAAQAPDITPSGDPSVASDTIYKLAVDSAAYPQQSSVLLLDDGVVRVERDGRTTTTYRQVIQILRERAVAGRREEEFGYDADRQRFRLNWARVVTPDGKIISEKPAQMQESDVPAAMDIPMYQHARVVRASLSGVAVGTLVDVSYTIETRSVDRTGDFYNSWRVTAGTMVRRSRFLVDAPADMPLTIAERHLTFKRSEQVVHGRRVYTWATKDVAWTKPERFAPDTVQQTQWVSLSAPGHWSDVGSWYMGLAHDRELAPNALRDTVKRLTANAKTRDDSIRAVHRWVAQDIRYVAIELGKGGYQPRLPATVMQTGFGDCKDKATLFVAALRAIGIDAYPVLLNAGGQVDSTLATIKAFNHEIAAVPLPNGGYQFVDLTSELNRYGTIPYADAGEFGLIVRPDGHTEEVRIPTDAPGSDAFELRQTSTLAPDGTVSGWFEQRGTGLAEQGMRATMRTPMDSTRRAEFMRAMAANLYPDAQGDSLVAFDGKDFTAKPRIAVHFHGGQAATRSGNTAILNLAAASAAAPFDRIADELSAAGERHMAIDAKQLVGPLTIVGEIHITLPDGWKARLPANDSATSEFGTYVARYSQNGREFIITRRIAGTDGVFPADKIGDLIAWLRKVGADRTPFVVLDTPTTT